MEYKALPSMVDRRKALQQLLQNQPLIDHAPRHASLRAQRQPAWRSRWTPLDAALPDAGWPACGLVELLQDAQTHAEWHLLAHALGERLRSSRGPLVLVGDDGLLPFAPALAAYGIAPQRLLWVRCAPALQRLWACEQALRCPEVDLVLAWLPQATPLALRRLQLLAQQSHKPLLAVRPASAAQHDSPARLRVLVRHAPQGIGVQLRVLKRPGAATCTAKHRIDGWIDLDPPSASKGVPRDATSQPAPSARSRGAKESRDAHALDRLAAA